MKLIQSMLFGMAILATTGSSMPQNTQELSRRYFGAPTIFTDGKNANSVNGDSTNPPGSQIGTKISSLDNDPFSKGSSGRPKDPFSNGNSERPQLEPTGHSVTPLSANEEPEDQNVPVEAENTGSSFGNALPRFFFR